jgi:hypothetical protein
VASSEVELEEVKEEFGIAVSLRLPCRKLVDVKVPQW